MTRQLKSAAGDRKQHFENLNHYTGHGECAEAMLGRFWKIDETIYDEFLGALPPEYCTNGFRLIEKLTGDIAATYLKIGGDYWCAYTNCDTVTPAHLSQVIATPHRIADFDGDKLTVRAGDYSVTITASSIEHNWRNVSFHEERRARSHLEELAAYLNEFAQFVDKTGSRQYARALDSENELARFAEKHVGLHRAHWSAIGRCASSMITGPSNFPVRRAQKANDAADRRFQEIREHSARARKSVERRAFPHGDPKQEIRTSNPDAPELLREKIAKMEATCDLRVAANKVVRRVERNTAGEPEAAINEAVAIALVAEVEGMFPALAAQIAKPNYINRRGFEGFENSNDRANIKRLKDRLASVERMQERGTVEHTKATTEGEIQIVENAEAARVQLIFPGKPDADTRTILKLHGFRWSPRFGAWQRHLNGAGRQAANIVLTKLQPEAS